MPRGVWERPITFKQKLVLYCRLPGPLGLGATVEETAFHLRMKEDTVVKVLYRMKKKYPWDNIDAIFHTSHRQQKGLKNIHRGDYLNKVENEHTIVERF